MPRGRARPPQAVTRLRDDTDVVMAAPRWGEYRLVQGTVVHDYVYYRPLDLALWWVHMWDGWHRVLKIGRPQLVRDYVERAAPGPMEALPKAGE